MTTVEGPKTVQDFERIKGTITELMSNRYCDPGMYSRLETRLEKTNAKIEELKK